MQTPDNTDSLSETDYRENIMPESPDIKTPTQQSPLNMTGGMGSTVRDVPRPQSGGTALPASGNHSPIGSINGGTMSPNLLVNSSVSQQLPPACGARQLSKLKRFLTTLQQFGSDISPEIGERVRTLVLALVNSHLSIEEFHSKLQEATNFPLRPFVIPFLKANLPLLQRELLHCARMAKQTPQQYLSQHEQILFDHTSPPNEPQDFSSEFNENGKRRSPDRPKENGIDSHPDHPVKRLHSSRVSPNGILNLNVGPFRSEDVNLSRELREHERQERARLEHDPLDRKLDREQQHYPSYNNYTRSDSFDPLDRMDDDWRHVETMLNCIIGMVDKTKRALAVLQERSLRDREELSLWMRRQAEGMDQDLKKRSSDMMSHTMRQTEDRVADVRRRAEEAVNEVKRQAMLELQKAVKAAEMKANELVTTERIKMERAVTDARKQAQEEVMTKVNHQEESSESCWNCGRKASETCSGCNTARYCGSFCQHKDWENHHLVCGKSRSSAPTGPALRPDSQKSAPSSPPQEAPEVVTQPEPSPVNSVERLSVSPRSSTGSPSEPKTSDVSR
ncbi:protein CBFA2T2-like isoform X4 [Mytilus galloprovincialis]